MRTSIYAAAYAATLSLFGQTVASSPAFEVASVKPSNPQGGRIGVGLFTYPGGRIVASGCPLDYLIQQAFDVQSFQIAGGPGWIHNDRFDIEAKPPASSLSSKANPFLGHQPKSYDRRARDAKPHSWKQIPEDVFAAACDTLNQIIVLGNRRPSLV
jgi:hypothetical protein